MAASLREVKLHTVKRKLNELEDISNIHTTPKQVKNNHKKQRVSFKSNEKPLTRHSLRQQQQQQQQQQDHQEDDEKHKQHKHQLISSIVIPQQQRSPSPSEGCSPPSAPELTRCKSVSFDLRNNSPLLTPKDDDDEEEYDDSEEVYSDQGVTSSVPSTPATPPASTTTLDDVHHMDIKSSYQNEECDLNTNPDYISLTSCLRLATKNRNKISQEIVQLSQLQQYHSQNENKEETIEFFLKLMNNDLNLPKPNKIIKCPIINWTKYHPALTNVSKEFEKFDQFKKKEIDDQIYKSLKMFNNHK